MEMIVLALECRWYVVVQNIPRPHKLHTSPFRLASYDRLTDYSPSLTEYTKLQLRI